MDSAENNSRILRFVNYLTALVKVNTRTIRDLEEFQKVLWLSEIPREPKHCFTRAWGEQEESGDDTWIEVKKFAEPLCPKVPDSCKNWVKRDTLRNTDELPELHQTITTQKEERNAETGETFLISRTLVIEEFPEVQKDWEAYVDKLWFPWTELYARYVAVQKIYSSFFLIHQELSKLGEQYELVLSLGLLTWLTPTGHQTRRHLVAAKVSLEFEPHLGKFTVKPTMDGDQAEVEFDMLDLEDQPQNAKQLSEEGRRIMRDNLWDRTALDSLLNAIANSLADSGQGEYYADRIATTNTIISKKPIVEYAPALVLRKRSARGLEYMLTKMKEQIESGVDIPNEFLDLCECVKYSEIGESNDDEVVRQTEVSEIYFPLQTNDEQRRIILTLNRQKGVLVQGPPGTGKSHTIANLICHLLAIGQRVLVTAKTPRALQVLHDKLPTEIKPLCISLLGNGTEERESLEKSVAGIVTKIDKRDSFQGMWKIGELEERVRQNHKAKAEADKKITALRESETYQHVLADGFYKGTAAQIARRLTQEANDFSWLVDRIAPDTCLPLLQDEINDLCRNLVELDPETERQLSLSIPNPDTELPDAVIVRALFEREEVAKEKVISQVERLKSPAARALDGIQSEAVRGLSDSLSDLAVKADTLRRRSFPWMAEAVNDVLSGKDSQWKELLKLSTSALEGLRDVATKADSHEVSISVHRDTKELLHSATAILNHFEAGGGRGFWIFKPKVIRMHGAVMDSVKVDGLACFDLQTVQKLIDHLVIEQRLEYLWSLWGDRVVRQNGRFLLQIAQLEDLHEALDNTMCLCSVREGAGKHIESVKGLNSPKWEDSTQLYELAETCQAVLAQIELRNVSRQLEQMHRDISVLGSRNRSHPICEDISRAFKERDIDNYSRFCQLLRELRKKAESVVTKREEIERLGKTASKLALSLAQCEEPKEWVERLRVLENAWAWARAKSWLDEFLATDAESLQRHSGRLADEIRRDLSELAAVKAWDFCFTRMQEGHRRHLMAWQQEMKKLGKGKGKHAHTHRKNAQRHLNECRDSVPAWIMPLHRVYETVEAGPGIFDVIIVDEASQCGPEGLPLMYLGKRILVVGDDKQISPEAVGVERGQVQRLMRDHLYDFSLADSFDVESSLFDHGRIRFGNRITLREHFRCMPEIINFSNDLCYRTDPLIPLRQYPPDRLEPLNAIYVPSGYREGEGQRVVNRPEAEVLADTVERCCRDRRYQGMTMGVIVLQGDTQAYVIEDLLLKRLGAEEMKERRLICGNPYSFQGDERDVIFLSMVAAPNQRIGVLNQAADQRRFNVASSRAQDQMWLFHSVVLNDLSQQCYRHRLLAYFYNPKNQIDQALGEDAEILREKAFRANRSVERPPSPFESWFEVDVALAIAGRGYRILPQYQFADKRIDLVIQGKKAQLAVECDGDFWHGPEEYAADMERQRKLERSGWHFFRLRESYYYAGPENALESLWTKLQSMGIMPVAEQTEEHTEQEIGFEMVPDDDENGESEFAEENGNDADAHENNLVEDSYSLAEGAPLGIDEALRTKQDVLARMIIEILQNRPNFSCMRDRMPAYILRRWNIRTRGIPWQRFAKKVDDAIAVMARKGYVTVYKSKNVRIRLGWERYPGVSETELKEREVEQTKTGSLKPTTTEGRILLFSKSTEVSSMLRGALEREGFLVDLAQSYDGFEGTYLGACNEKYDVILPTNFGLNPEDISSVVSKCKLHCPNTKIVVLSGYDSSEFSTRLKKLGVDDFFLSPFKTSDLVRCLRRQLSR